MIDNSPKKIQETINNHDDQSEDQSSGSAAPKISLLSTKDKLEKQNIKENKSINLNMKQIYKREDLSPRQMRNLEGKNKKGVKYNLPLSINTRRKKGSSHISGQ